MINSNKRHCHGWSDWQFKIQILTSYVDALLCRSELVELVAWARRKQLTKIRKNYQQRLHELDGKLLIYRVRSPGMFGLAEWICTFKRQLQPRPTYYPKGYASKYRKRQSRSFWGKAYRRSY